MTFLRELGATLLGLFCCVVLLYSEWLVIASKGMDAWAIRTLDRVNEVLR